MLPIFTFDAPSLTERPPASPEIIFYDGHCGLCHHTVQFVLPRDREGRLFRFAPLQSAAFLQRVPEAQRKTLPDSVIVLTHGGGLLTRSDAILHILEKLGGIWRALSILVGWIPKLILDACYDGVARVRYRLFSPPAGVCPVIPPDLRSRFINEESEKPRS